MTLDILTPRGQEAAADQLRATEIVFGRSADHEFIHTRTDDSAAIDGFIVTKGTVTGLAEVKSREMSYEHLMGQFNGEWILTMQKLKDIAEVSRLLRLQGYGFIYCKPSHRVLVVPLTAVNGDIMCLYRTDTTDTQRSCNGGTATRLNAFIDVREARIYDE